MNAGQIKAKLDKEKVEAIWDHLRPHAEKGALICVTRSVLLTDAGTAVALNDMKLVSGWMEEESIYKPSSEQIEKWNEEPHKLFFMTIVQPFVLVQEMTKEEEQVILAEKAEKKADA